MLYHYLINEISVLKKKTFNFRNKQYTNSLSFSTDRFVSQVFHFNSSHMFSVEFESEVFIHHGNTTNARSRAFSVASVLCG